ncbi:hypothetical protein Cni_G19369 [Canna indica]|uniref:DUF4283 domain-containing protein n=1 Tax=Canna indica TaxID=4628 RepID=A0AAQ3KM99_9LILI|nr:hypothetical protein Cni_G19369 [Canna indica]
MFGLILTLKMLFDLENDFFLFRFDSEENAIKVLSGGPWAFRGNLINLKHWVPNFQALTEIVSSAPIWVQFPDLPMKYWLNKTLFKIAFMIGKPIKVDDNSFNWERGKFVRICNEIDFNKSIKQGVWIGRPGVGIFQAVRYERLPQFCFRCCLIGHRLDECNNLVSETSMKVDNDVANAVDSLTSAIKDIHMTNIDKSIDCMYGPWVKVARKPRKFFSQQSYVEETDHINEKQNTDREANVLPHKEYHSASLNRSIFEVTDRLVMTSEDISKTISFSNNFVQSPTVLNYTLYKNKDDIVNNTSLNMNDLAKKVASSLQAFNCDQTLDSLKMKDNVKDRTNKMASRKDRLTKIGIHMNLDHLDSLASIRKRKGKKI